MGNPSKLVSGCNVDLQSEEKAQKKERGKNWKKGK